MYPELSVIIPTYKRRESLKRTLNSFVKAIDSSTEVIIVDQSPDFYKNIQYFKNTFPEMKFIFQKKPNLPEARNRGIKESRGDIVLFIDDDMTVDKNCLREHVSTHKQKGTCAVAGRVKQRGGVKWADTETAARVDRDTGETEGNFDIDYSGKVEYAFGGHFSVKREIFRTAGCFNPGFKGNALFEDIDFFMRIRKKGFYIWYNPKAVSCHYSNEEGGCREAGKKEYLLDRIYNHTLFYVRNLKIIPTLGFLRYQKNLIEFISRKKNGGYSIILISAAAGSIIRAYINASVSWLLQYAFYRKYV